MPEIIPVNANVHHKTAFDIVTDGIEPMTYIRRIIRTWCEQRTQCTEGLMYRKWFMAGNTPTTEPAQYCINSHYIRTAVAQSQDPREPNCWAMELIHHDSDELSRRWAVEIVLRRTDSGRITLTTVVSNWITPYFIGEYPPPPSPSVPRYISDLVKDPSLKCLKGETRLLSRHELVETHNTRNVYETIKSEKRFVPCVVISYHVPSKGPLLDPRRVGIALTGSANTYFLGSTAVNEELNFYLEHPYDLAQGTIRVFLPGIDRTNPHDPKRHRYLSESFIAERGGDTIIRYLTNGLCRNASSFRLNDLTSFADVLAERRKQKIAVLAKERESLASEKIISAADTDLMWEEIRTLTKEASEWETTAGQLDEEVQRLRRDNGTLNARVTEADRVRGRIQDLTAQAEGFKQLECLPTSLTEVLEAVARIYPTRISVAEQALTSARRHSNDFPDLWEKIDGIRTAWKMAYSLAAVLHPLVYDDGESRLEELFNAKVSEMSLALNETGTTRRDAALMALRRLEHDGASWDITPHLKYGNRNPKMLRLHFAFDKEKRRFIVGHFGDHLDTASTRLMS